MCFSPEASFATAAATGAVGILAIQGVERPRDLPLAAIPLVFSAQQAIEGALWLTLRQSPDGAASSLLALVFLIVAQAVWPVFAPFAALSAERDAGRRRLMAACLAVGVGVGGLLLWELLQRPPGALIRDGHICYVTQHAYPDLTALAYVLATAAPLLISSHRAVTLLGAVILAGYVTTYIFYREAFASVWCFFAAAASVILLAHVRGARAGSLNGDDGRSVVPPGPRAMPRSGQAERHGRRNPD